MYSRVLTMLTSSILLAGCHALQGTQRTGSVYVPGLDTSGTSSIPLPRGAARPFPAPQGAPVVKHPVRNPAVQPKYYISQAAPQSPSVKQAAPTAQSLSDTGTAASTSLFANRQVALQSPPVKQVPFQSLSDTSSTAPTSQYTNFQRAIQPPPPTNKVSSAAQSTYYASRTGPTSQFPNGQAAAMSQNPSSVSLNTPPLPRPAPPAPAQFGTGSNPKHGVVPKYQSLSQRGAPPLSSAAAFPHQPTSIYADISSRQSAMSVSQQPTSIQADISSRQSPLSVSQQPTSIQAAVSSRQSPMSVSQQPTSIQAAISSRQIAMSAPQQATSIQAAISSRRIAMSSSQQFRPQGSAKSLPPGAASPYPTSHRLHVSPVHASPLPGSNTQHHTLQGNTLVGSASSKNTHQLDAQWLGYRNSQSKGMVTGRQATTSTGRQTNQLMHTPKRPQGTRQQLASAATIPQGSPFSLFLSQFQPKTFSPLTNKPAITPINIWLKQNRWYISQIESARAAWKAKIMALTAATGRLQMRLSNLPKRQEQEEQRKRTIMPRLYNVIPVFSSKDTVNVIGIDDATGDLDCEYVPSHYPGSCDDDRCPAGKECRSVSGVMLCCPPSVTSGTIKRKAYYDY